MKKVASFLKYLLVGLFALIALIGVLSYSFSNEILDLGVKKIKKSEILKNEGLSFNEYEFSISTSEVSLTLLDLKIVRDIPKAEDSLNIHVEVEVDTFSITNFQFLDFYSYNEFKIHDVGFYNPSIRINIKDSSFIEKGFDSIKKEQKSYSINLNEFKFLNSNLELCRNDTLFFSFDSLDLITQKLRLNSENSLGEIEFYDFSFSIKNLKYINEKLLTSASVESINGGINHLNELQLFVNEVTFYDEKNSYLESLKFPYRKTFFKDFELGDLSLKTKPDAIKNFINGEILVDLIDVSDVTFEFYKNTVLPLDSNRFIPPILGLIKSIKPYHILVDKMNVKNSNVYYNEKVNKTLSPFRVALTNGSVEVNNFDNRTSKGLLSVDFKSKLIDKFELSSLIKVDYNSGKQYLKGKLLPIKPYNGDLSAFNDLLGKALGVTIKKGYLIALYYNVEANNDFSRGEVVFTYERLKLKLGESVTKKQYQKVAAQSIANNIIITPSNPYNLKTRTGEIKFIRDKNKSFTHYWVHSILTGVVETILPGKFISSVEKTLSVFKRKKNRKKRQKK